MESRISTKSALVTSIGALALLTAVGAAAQEQPASPTASAKPAGTAKDNIRRDPKGIQGISPFWESIKLGDSAYLARDYDGALAQYQNAITKEPQNPLGHLRMAEAQMAKGALPDAEQSSAAAARFADKDPTLKGRALMLQAWLHERQKQYDRAADAWKAYQQFAREQPKARVHQRTPPERLKQIQVAKQLSEDYAAVKERIAKRLKDAEDTAKQNAK